MPTQQKTDWSLTPRSTLAAAGQGALGVAVLGTVGHDLLHLSPFWPLAAATVGGVASVVRGLERTPGALAYHIGCWVSAGGWLSWSWAYGPWKVLPVLALGALTAGLLAPIGRRTRPKPGDRAPDPGSLVAREHADLARQWTSRIHRVSRVRVTVEQALTWPDSAGFSLLLLQPPGASTTNRLAGAAQGLAEDARLPHGCNVEFAAGPRRGTLWMHVATVNRLPDVIPHPGIRLGGSINDPSAVRFGLLRDGRTATMALRESTAVVAGQKRSGKSGLLHNVTADLGSLDDALPWQMDLNGGGISRAWLRPWLTGRTERPAIDWAAPCPEEALLMGHAMVNIAVDRKSAHHELKARHNVQLLPVSRQVPAIVLVLDEGKEVLGAKISDQVVKQIRRSLETVVDIGGNEAVNAVLSVLRSISTALSMDVLRQCSTRVTMRVFDQPELDYLFGYHRGITPQDAVEQGSGFEQGPGGDVRVFKAFFMLPADIEAAAVQIAQHRPDLDPDAVAAAGEAYATRYERMRWLFSTPAERARLAPPEPIVLPGVVDGRGQPYIWDPAATHPAVGGAPRATDSAVEVRRPGHLELVRDGVTSGWAAPETIAARAGRPAPLRGPEPPARLRAEQVHSLPAARPVPELLLRALDAFGADDRIHSSVLADILGLDQTELGVLLAAVGVRTLPNAFLRGGQRGRGYAREDIEEAADTISAGRMDVPPEVASWPAA